MSITSALGKIFGGDNASGISKKVKAGVSGATDSFKKAAAKSATDNYVKQWSNISNDLIGEGKSKLSTLGNNMWDELSLRKVGQANIEDFVNSKQPLTQLYDDILTDAQTKGVKANVSKIRNSMKSLSNLELGQTSATRKAMSDYLHNITDDMYGEALTTVKPKQATLKSLDQSIQQLQNKIDSTKLSETAKKALQNALKTAETPAQAKQVANVVETATSPTGTLTMENNGPVVAKGVNRYKAGDDYVKPTGMEEITSRYQNATKHDGGSTSIVLPDGTELSGRYKLVEAGTATPSHDPKTFAMSNGFPTTSKGTTINDRDYNVDKNAQNQVRMHAQNYDGRAFADNGIIVSKDGIVLSGNDRTMAGQLAAMGGTDTAYNDYLRRNAGKYGFSAQQVDAMQHPRVVFELDDDLKYDTDTFAAFNKSGQKGKSVLERAKEYGKTIDSERLSNVAHIMDDFDTADQVFSNVKASRELANELVNMGVISSAELPEFYNGKTLTGAGKDLVSSVLLGSVVDEANLPYFANNSGIQFKLMKTAPALLENKSFGDYSIMPELNNAIRLYARASEQGQDVGIFAKQSSLFDDLDRSDITVKLAELLEQRGYKNFQNFVNKYNQATAPAAGGQVDMLSGGVQPKESLIAEALKTQDIEPSEKVRLNVEKKAAKDMDDELVKAYQANVDELNSLKASRQAIQDEINATMDGATVDYNTLKAIREGAMGRAADIQSRGIGATADEVAQLKFYRQLSDILDDEINAGLKGYSPEVKQRLVQTLTDMGAEPNLIKHYADKADADVSIADIRHELSPYYFANDVLTQSRRGTAKSPLPGLEVGSNGRIKGSLGTVGNKALEKAERVVAGQSDLPVSTSSLGKLLKGAAVLGVGSSVLSQIMGGSGSGADMLNEYPINSQQPDTSDDDIINQLLNQYLMQSMGMGNSGIGGMYGMPQQQQTLGGYTADDFKNAYVAALVDGNTTMANQYAKALSMFETQDDTKSNLDNIYQILKIQQLQKNLSSTSDSNTKKKAALNTLSNLMNNYEAQGVIGGNITNFLNGLTGGAFNPKTYAYTTGSKGSLGGIIKAMGDTGALSEGDQKRALELIPSNTDSPAAARAKYQQLVNILNNADASNTMVLYGD